jgi:ABC-type cobalamin transport system permease subunit
MRSNRLRRALPFVFVGAALAISGALLFAVVADGAVP